MFANNDQVFSDRAFTNQNAVLRVEIIHDTYMYISQYDTHTPVCIFVPASTLDDNRERFQLLVY